MRKDQWIGVGLVLALLVLVGVGLWKTAGRHDRSRTAVIRQYQGVMGTRCQMTAVVPRRSEPLAEAAMAEAESTLRRLEARLSTWIDDSELSAFNAAPADQPVALSAETLEVLRAARAAGEQTGGAFDVTCRRLIELWHRAAECGQVPDETELHDAREDSRWEFIELTDVGAVKRRRTARLDVDGIAKGYAIDRAAEVLRRAGLDGGLVEIGGDLVCFGRPPQGETWTVGVVNPFGPGKLGELRLAAGAVCTSGDYARGLTIAGRCYSHIIDPRTSLPVEEVPSVTVVAAEAMTADVWATALSVLRIEGLKRLPPGVEAMLVVGTEDDHRVVCTAGFVELLAEAPEKVEVIDRRNSQGGSSAASPTSQPQRGRSGAGIQRSRIARIGGTCMAAGIGGARCARPTLPLA